MPRFVRLGTAIVFLLSLFLVACGGPATSTPSATTALTRAATTAPTTAAASVNAPATAPTASSAPASTAAATAAPSGTTAASSAPSGTVTAATGTLTVFAAASLTDAYNELKTGFQAANPGITVTYSFAGSQVLVTQLTQGAPADVFASADQPNMDNAVKGGAIAGTPQTFAKNKLVIILPKENKAGIQRPKDLAKAGVKFDTAQESVPVGNYTQQVLDNFSKLPDYGADFKANVNKNIVSKEDNVKAIVQKVQLGEVDAGIVYTTDAQAAADKLTMIPIPDAQNVIASYPIAVVKGAKQAALGQKFVDYVLSPAGQAVMKKWGFAPPA
jgi:molybdate transport system substrate-binding protein